MTIQECCKTCQHCHSGHSAQNEWCGMRQIPVHEDIAQFAVCHHWTKRAPSLPKIEENMFDLGVDRQLELDRSVAGNLNGEF